MKLGLIHVDTVSSVISSLRSSTGIDTGNSVQLPLIILYRSTGLGILRGSGSGSGVFIGIVSKYRFITSSGSNLESNS